MSGLARLVGMPGARRVRLALGLAVLLALGACGSVPRAPSPGGYYQDDGPGATPPADLDDIPDAVPRDEPPLPNANRPYTVMGVSYVPETRAPRYRAQGIASWYGKKFHGRRTSSGEPYDMYAMTAAHPTLPIPSYVRVTHLRNGRSVVVRVNDRGPFLHRRLIDLSYAAAHKLGYADIGTAPVEVERVFPDDDAPAVAVRSRSFDDEADAAERGRAPPAPELAAPAEPEVLPLGPAPAPDLTFELVPPAAPEAPSAEWPESGPARATPAGATIWLQLGAFGSRQNAEQALRRAQATAARMGASLALVQQSGLWRVHLGPWQDRAEAAAVASHLSAQGAFKPVTVVR